MWFFIKNLEFYKNSGISDYRLLVIMDTSNFHLKSLLIKRNIESIKFAFLILCHLLVLFYMALKKLKKKCLLYFSGFQR